VRSSATSSTNLAGSGYNFVDASVAAGGAGLSFNNTDDSVAAATLPFNFSLFRDIYLAGSQISIADLERLANKTYPVSGTLALNVSVHGSQLNPIGQGTITVTKAKVSTESIQNLSVKFEGDGNTIKANLTVQMPAGTARADIDYFPKTEGYDAHVQALDVAQQQLFSGNIVVRCYCRLQVRYFFRSQIQSGWRGGHRRRRTAGALGKRQGHPGVTEEESQRNSGNRSTPGQSHEQ